MHNISKIMQLMQNSPTAAFIRDCSLHEQIMLASLIKCMNKTGVEEVLWADISDQHHNYTTSLPDAGESPRRLTNSEMESVMESLVASRAMLLEDGAIVARKALGERRVVLNLDQGEVERVLSEKYKTWRNVFSS